MKRTKPLCSIQNKHLRISYNSLKPFFNSENNKIASDTIEGAAILTFIEKHNLTTQLINENYKWGKKDDNGTWDGVVGRVEIN